MTIGTAFLARATTRRTLMIAFSTAFACAGGAVLLTVTPTCVTDLHVFRTWHSKMIGSILEASSGKGPHLKPPAVNLRERGDSECFQRRPGIGLLMLLHFSLVELAVETAF